MGPHNECCLSPDWQKCPYAGIQQKVP
jgi:hypothetical protein